MMTVVRSLAVALVCLACADAENQRDAHYIQTVPEEKLDSIPMPRTPG
jgi:hypothetical protein